MPRVASSFLLQWWTPHGKAFLIIIVIIIKIVMETLFEFLNVQLVNLAIYRQFTNAALDNNNNININN